MSRNRKQRKVSFLPEVTYFKPQGVPLRFLEEEVLASDEIEAIRLVDLEGQDQTQAAKKMAVSQSTLHRILLAARKKIAKSLILNRAIALKGGEEEMPPGRGMRINAPKGGGRGRMGGQFAVGPGGKCACTNPDCQCEIDHRIGIPCYKQKCPKCNSPMIRKRE